MELNQIFYKNQYEEAYYTCAKHGWTITEIEADEKGRRFQIVENKPSETDLLQNEMQELKQWLDVYYSQHEQKYRRLHTLNILTDEGTNPYEELVKLYQEAETKRKRIQQIEVLLNEMARQG